MGKSDHVALVAARSGVLGVIRNCRHHVLRDLRILAYHRVLPRMDEAVFPFGADLISAWSEEFDWQVKYASSNFDILTFQDVVELIDSGQPFPARPLVVTFDDGFSDNYEHAYPILLSRKVPAVIFLTTGQIGSEDTFWFEWLAYAIMHTNCLRLPSTFAGGDIDLSSGVVARRAALIKQLRHLKRVSNDERVAILARLHTALGVSIPPEVACKSRALNWDQVREMLKGGIEFGSHTVTHPILSNVTTDFSLDRELQDSRSAIERQIGRPVFALAYPVGGASAFDDRVVDASARAGYRLAVTYLGGINKILDLDHFRLKRIRVEREIGRDLFRARLELPEVFARER